MGSLREHLSWATGAAALALALVAGGFSVACAEGSSPSVGAGMGLGEHGTFGVSLRARVANRVGLEAGGGLYYYRMEDEGERISGFQPCWGAEVVWYLTDAASPTQHGIGFVYEGQQVLGHQYGMSYRYEGPFGGSGIGYHLEVGLLYGPQARGRAEVFFGDETGKKPHDLDFHYLPVLLKVGVHF